MQGLLLFVIATGSLQEPATEYRYVSSKKTHYYQTIDGLVYYGTINEAGDFEPSPNFQPVRAGLQVTGGNARLLTSGKKQESVFEYRFGRLVPGHIEHYHFIPEIGGIIIEMKQYRYAAAARRIYNLPGRFVTKETYEELARRGELTDQDK